MRRCGTGNCNGIEYGEDKRNVFELELIAKDNQIWKQEIENRGDVNFPKRKKK